MGAVRLIYDETTRQLKRAGFAGEFNLKDTRKFMQGPLRYCLQGNSLYLPLDTSIVDEGHRLCWGRARIEYFDDHPWLNDFDVTLEVNPLDYHMPFSGIGFGAVYSKRHRETEQGRVPGKSFISQSLIDSLSENPEVLQSLSKDDFESLVGELFARMGCDVDMYRGSKDDGIDFLAIKTDGGDPIITSVQCKHPDIAKAGKQRRPLPVAAVREIYGVAKANNLNRCFAVTSSRYTPDAKAFSELKPDEISVANAEDVFKWINKYRWNTDE